MIGSQNVLGFCVWQLPGPSSRHMSFKNQRRCSKLEHHNGAPPIMESDEKPPMGNGGIVLTNVVSRIFSPFFALG